MELWYTSQIGHKTAFLRTLFRAIYNNDGEIDGGVFIMEDISDRKKAEDELQKTFKKLADSEEKFKAIFYTTPDPININSLKGTYMDVNESFSRISGYTAEDVMGKTAQDLNIWADPEDRVFFRNTIQDKGGIENFETRLRRKDESVITVLISAKVIQLNNETHIISVSKDISELKRTTEELTRLKSSLEELVESRTAELKGVLNEQKIILDHIGVGVMLLVDRKIIWANQEMARIFGYTDGLIPPGTSTRFNYKDDQDYLGIRRKDRRRSLQRRIIHL